MEPSTRETLQSTAPRTSGPIVPAPRNGLPGAPASAAVAAVAAAPNPQPAPARIAIPIHKINATDSAPLIADRTQGPGGASLGGAWESEAEVASEAAGPGLSGGGEDVESVRLAWAQTRERLAHTVAALRKCRADFAAELSARESEWRQGLEASEAGFSTALSTHRAAEGELRLALQGAERSARSLVTENTALREMIAEMREQHGKVVDQLSTSLATQRRLIGDLTEGSTNADQVAAALSALAVASGGATVAAGVGAVAGARHASAVDGRGGRDAPTVDGGSISSRAAASTAAEARAAAAESSLAVLSQQLTALQHEHASTNRYVALLRAECAEFRQASADAASEQAAAAQSAARANDALKAARNALSTAEARSTKLDSLCADLKAEAARAGIDADTARATLSASTIKLKGAESQLQRVTQQLAASQEAAAALQAQVIALSTHGGAATGAGGGGGGGAGAGSGGVSLSGSSVDARARLQTLSADLLIARESAAQLVRERATLRDELGAFCGHAFCGWPRRGKLVLRGLLACVCLACLRAFSFMYLILLRLFISAQRRSARLVDVLSACVSSSNASSDRSSATTTTWRWVTSSGRVGFQGWVIMGVRAAVALVSVLLLLLLLLLLRSGEGVRRASTWRGEAEGAEAACPHSGREPVTWRPRAPLGGVRASALRTRSSRRLPVLWMDCLVSCQSLSDRAR